VATIWIPPSTMDTSAQVTTARAVIKTDASSQIPDASRLMPPEQRAISVAVSIAGPMAEVPRHACDLPA